jgi:hypothetical protein
MRTASLSLAACALLVLASSADEPKKPVAPREIGKGTLPSAPKGADVAKPTRINNAKVFLATFPDKDRRDEVLKKVNFANEHVLYFVWTGSVTDRLTAEVEEGKKGQVVFTFTPGNTDDAARPRYRVFVIGKDDTFRVVTKK